MAFLKTGGTRNKEAIMYKLVVSGAALLLLSVCVSSSGDVESSSDEYIPEGYDPDAGPAEPSEPDDDPYVPERSEEGPRGGSANH